MSDKATVLVDGVIDAPVENKPIYHYCGGDGHCR